MLESVEAIRWRSRVPSCEGWASRRSPWRLGKRDLCSAGSAVVYCLVSLASQQPHMMERIVPNFNMQDMPVSAKSSMRPQSTGRSVVYVSTISSQQIVFPITSAMPVPPIHSMYCSMLFCMASVAFSISPVNGTLPASVLMTWM